MTRTSSSPARAKTKTLFASLLACTGAAALASPDARAAGQVATVAISHTFGAATGSAPFDGLLKATDGNYYGTTSNFEAGNGVIYKYTPDGKYSILHTFKQDGLATPPVLEGVNPGPLIQAKDGNLYGVCIGGGKYPTTPNGAGTFFKITLAGVFTKLYDFDTNKTNAPEFPTAIVQGGDGNFYGCTREGGKTGKDEGTFFRITPDGKTFTELYTFHGNTSLSVKNVGYEPQAQLLVGKDGNFYGTASASGTDGNHSTAAQGTVFKATMAGEVTLFCAFQDSDDGLFHSPRAVDTPLIQIADGSFYGVSTYGGNQDFGTIYRISPTGVLTVLHNFTNTSDGSEPSGRLVQGSDGTFYGGLRAGLPAGSNIVQSGPGGYYQIRANGTFTLLHRLSNTAKGPHRSYGNLVELSKGLFAGITGGGSAGLGTLLRITVSPAIISAPTATATAGEPFSYQIKATNGAVSYGVIGLAKGLTIDKASGLITGAPETAGTKSMTLVAVNAGGQGTLPLTLTVKAQ